MIAGWACRIGKCKTPDDFWAALASGVDFGGVVDHQYQASGASPGFCLNLIDGKESFDAKHFQVIFREAKVWSPARKLLLSCAWEAIEMSGMSCDLLRGKNVSTYYAVNESDYLFPLDGFKVGAVGSWGHGDLAYFFSLSGRAIAIDCACSSGLVGLSLAFQDCVAPSDRCFGSFAAAGQTINSPGMISYLIKMGIVSPSGRCRTFDSSANGYMRSEGCGVVLLLSNDSSMHQHSQVVIRSVFSNNDGRSNGRGVPRGAGQMVCFEKALVLSGLAAVDVNQYEAQGTGTLLADSTEAKSACAVYGRTSSARKPLVIQSVKTLIGHCESASGILGVIRSIMALRSARLPPHINFETISGSIGSRLLEAGNCVIPLESIQKPWRFFIAESHFGSGGTNGHIIFQGGSPLEISSVSPLNFVVLSSRTEAALRILIKKHVEFLVLNAQCSVGLYCSMISTREFANETQGFIGVNRKVLVDSLRSSHYPLRTLEVSSKKNWHFELCVGGKFCLPNGFHVHPSARRFQSPHLRSILAAVFQIREYGVLIDSFSGLGLSRIGLACAIDADRSPADADELFRTGVARCEHLWTSKVFFSDSICFGSARHFARGFDVISSSRAEHTQVLDLVECVGARAVHWSAWKLFEPSVEERLQKFCNRINNLHTSSFQRGPKWASVIVGNSCAVRQAVSKAECVFRFRASREHLMQLFSLASSARRILTLARIAILHDVPLFEFSEQICFLPQDDVDVGGRENVKAELGPCAFCNQMVQHHEKVSTLPNDIILHERCILDYQEFVRECDYCHERLEDLPRKEIVDCGIFHRSCFDSHLKCAHCGEFVKPEEVLIFNASTIHARCIVAYRSAMIKCAFCQSYLNSAEEVQFNGFRVHARCLAPFRSASKYELGIIKEKLTLLERKDDPAVSGLEESTNVPFGENVRDRLTFLFCHVLGTTSFETSRPLSSFGFDSMTLAEVRSLIREETGVQLNSTFLFEFPSFDALCEFVEQNGGHVTSPRARSVHSRQSLQQIKQRTEEFSSFLGRHHVARFCVQLLLCLVLLSIYCGCLLVSFTFSRLVLYPLAASALPLQGAEFLFIPLTFPISGICLMAVCVPVKWVLIGRYKEGKYPLWGSFFLRWWFVNRLFRITQQFAFGALLKDSFIAKLWYLSLGVKMSWSVYIAHHIHEFDLVTLKANSGFEGSIDCSIMNPTFLELKKVVLEEGSWVGLQACVYPGNTLPSGCMLSDLSCFLEPPPEASSPINSSVLVGSPARFAHREEHVDYAPNDVSEYILLDVLRCLLRIAAQIVFLGASFAPSVVLFNLIQANLGIWLAVGSLLLLMPLLIPSIFVCAILFKWMLLWRVRPGLYSLRGFFSFRRSIFVSSTSTFLNVLVVIWNYAPWLPLIYLFLGGRVSRQSLFGVSYLYGETCWDVVTVGKGNFLGPLVTLKTWRFSNSHLIISPISIGDDCSIGTLSVVQGGVDVASSAKISSGSLISRTLTGGAFSGVPLKTISSVPREQVPVIYFPWWDYILPVFFIMWFWAVFTAFAFASFVVVKEWSAFVLLMNPSLATSTFEYLALWSGVSFSILIFVFGYPIVGAIVYRVVLDRTDVVRNVNWRTRLTNMLEYFLHFDALIFGGTSLLNFIYSLWGASIENDAYIDSIFFMDQPRITLGKKCVVLGIVDPHGPGAEGWTMRYGSLKLGDNCVLERLSLVSLELQGGDYVRVLPLSRVVVGDKVSDGRTMCGSPAVEWKSKVSQ